MLKVYDRIYYTFYRLTLKVADMFEIERETPRAEVALTLSLLTGINIITILGLLGALLGKPILPEEKIHVMMILSPIVALNFLLIFYKKRYKKTEDNFSSAWNNEKKGNILLTIFYMLSTIIFFCLLIHYRKNHAIHK